MNGGVLGEPLLHWLGKNGYAVSRAWGQLEGVGGGIGFVVWSSLKHFMEVLALPVNMLIRDEPISDQVRVFLGLPFNGMSCHKQPTHSLQICGNSQ